MKKISILLLISLLGLFSACSDWFDVQPKTQVKGDDLFSTENGYRTALFGVYTSMASNLLYGGDLTMGFMDVLGQYYQISSQANSYYEAKNYNYDDERVKAYVNTFWKRLYKAITNVNNLLENMDSHPNMLGKVQHDIIRGEALGLRAYLHFDLLRMFAPSFAVGENELAIPYVDRVSTTIFPQLTNNEVVERVLEDIDEALLYLRDVDPWSEQRKVTEYTEEEQVLLQYRRNRLNYLALGALKARVLLWANRQGEARETAEELIQQDSIGTPGSVIFSLYNDKNSDYAESYFGANVYSRLTIGTTLWKELYKVTDDQEQSGRYRDSRAVNFVGKYDGSPEPTVIKYRENSMWSEEVPLLRVNELYYILAECAMTEEDALNYLNDVREVYGWAEEDALRPGLCNVEEEIFNEYRKTFPGEGQLFYYMKRKDVKKLPVDIDIQDLRSIWCFRFPDDELEFGNVKQ